MSCLVDFTSDTFVFITDGNFKVEASLPHKGHVNFWLPFA